MQVGRLSFFFFQAEDGIRDYKVTGVQTCALPILPHRGRARGRRPDPRVARCVPRARGDARGAQARRAGDRGERRDRKSTRLNSSHLVISYAVFCLKKKTRLAEQHETLYITSMPDI